MSPDELKRQQRSKCLECRAALTPEQRARYSAAICRRLEALPAVQEADVIFSYMAAGAEADLSGFHAWAEKQGKRIAFPVSHPGGMMDFYIPQCPEAFETGRYGIRTPICSLSTPVSPGEADVIIIPCVGFDAGGGRIGHGGGYYDRYLPKCHKAERVLVAFEAQRMERVAQGEHDQTVDAVVTEAVVTLI